MNRYEKDSWNDYRASDRINFSRLKKMGTSPKHYRANPSMSTGALSIGRAIHTAVLEPHLFADEFAIFDGDKRKKEWKLFQAENEGREIITAKDAMICASVVEAVQMNPYAKDLLAGTEREVTAYWEHDGMRLKSRIDALGSNAVIDLKSTVSVEPDAFARTIAKYSYHMQAAYYHDACKAVDGIQRDCYMIAVEKVEPYDCAVYRLSYAALEQGRVDYRRMLSTLSTCTLRDQWPGVSQGIRTLDLPDWAYDADLDFGVQL